MFKEYNLYHTLARLQAYPTSRLLVVFLLFISSVCYAQVPVIKEVTPNSAYAGQIISIKGVNFNANSKVLFGGSRGNVVSWTDQLLEVEVPTSATYDLVSVTNTNTGLTGYSPMPFMLSFGGTQGLSATDFGPQQNFPARSGLYDLCVCDLDGDGKNDVVGTNSKDNNITILRNISTVGDIKFTTENRSISALSLNIKCADLNGDTKPDLVISEFGNGSRIFVLKNISTVGNINFSQQQFEAPNNSTKRVDVNDIDLDGKPEIIVTDQAKNNVSVLKNTSTISSISFSAAQDFSIDDGIVMGGLVVRDLNNDLKPDIVASNFLKDGKYFFSESSSTPGNIQLGNFNENDISGIIINMQTVDLNNDRKADLLATRYLSADIAIMTNQSAKGGSISFGSTTMVGTAAVPWGIDVGDMANDHHIGLIFQCLPDKQVTVVLGS